MSIPTPEEKLAAVFNKDRVDNSLPTIDFNEYVFQAPTPFVGTRNTRIYAIPALASLYVGRITLYYDRIALSTVVNLSVTKGSATTVHELLDQINEELGIILTTADVADAALPGSGGFTLTATSVNKLFTGSTTVTYRV
jgi:hypothetical protein